MRTASLFQKTSNKGNERMTGSKDSKNDNRNENNNNNIPEQNHNKRLSRPNIIAIILGALDVIFAAISYFILPAQVVVQIKTSSGTPNILAKPFAILVPFVITAASVVLYIKPDYQNNKKAIVSAVIGLALFVVIWFANL